MRLHSPLAWSIPLALAACSGGRAPATSPAPGATLAVTGSLTYRARVALPPDAMALVEVREGSAPDGPVVGEQRIEMKGRQVPVAFEVQVNRARLAQGRRYFARGSMVVGGTPSWISEPVAVDVTRERVDAGTLVLAPFRPSTVVSTLQCGNEHATIGWVADGAELSLDGETFRLRQARSASGARYVAAEDSTTWMWNKGDETRVSVRGREYPTCRVAGTADETFRAHGNEPFWGLEITRTTITFSSPDAKPISLPAGEPALSERGRRYAARSEGHQLTATVSDKACQDGMSGMTYPNTVSVTVDGRELHGCGGDPGSLLAGSAWVVEDIDHKGIIDDSRVTLTFAADGKLTGRAGCNSYTGRWKLTGETLTIGSTAATQMACADALMRQEQVFLSVLAGVERFDLDRTGALVLTAKDGRTLTARR